MARAISYTATETTIKVKVTGLDSGYDWDDREITWVICNTSGKVIDRKYGDIGANVTSTSYTTFTGLTPGTEYEVEYEIIFSSTKEGLLDQAVYGSKTVYTDEAAIEPFSWDTAKTAGNSFNVTASEWNRLIDKITEVYTYLGWPNYQDTYPITKVTKGGIFYAARFNEVRAAIGNLYSTGISDKSKGDIITAADLNQLVTSLNAKIDSL